MATVDIDPNPSRETLYRFVKILRGSLLLSTVVMGLALLFVAAIFEYSAPITKTDGVIAGMLGVFGVSAIVGGSLFYVLLTLLQRSRVV